MGQCTARLILRKARCSEHCADRKTPSISSRPGRSMERSMRQTEPELGVFCGGPETWVFRLSRVILRCPMTPCFRSPAGFMRCSPMFQSAGPVNGGRIGLDGSQLDGSRKYKRLCIAILGATKPSTHIPVGRGHSGGRILDESDVLWTSVRYDD